MTDGESSAAASTAVPPVRRPPYERSLRSWRQGQRRPAWALVFITGGLVLWGLYVALVAWLVPRELRSAAEEAGLELSLGSARSFHPGALQLEGVRIGEPGSGWALALERVVVETRWRALFSDEPAVEVARASGAALRWPGGELGPFEATLRVHGTTEGGRGGWLSIDAGRTHLRALSLDATLALRARIELERWSLSGAAAGLDLGDGAVEASQLRLAGSGSGGGAAVAPSPAVMLRVESGRWGFGAGLTLLGRLHASGPDAGLLLDLAEADPGARWMLADLEQQGFELEAVAHVCPRGLELDRVHAESGLVLASGALHVRRSEASGAFLVRRGSFALGVSVLGDAVATHQPSHSPSWLAAELAQLASPCAS